MSLMREMEEDSNNGKIPDVCGSEEIICFCFYNSPRVSTWILHVFLIFYFV